MRCLLGCQEPLQKLLLLSFCIFHLHLLRLLIYFHFILFPLTLVWKVSHILALSATHSLSVPPLPICTSIFTCALAIIRFMLSQAQHVTLYLPLQRCPPACDCPNCLSRVSTQFAALSFCLTSAQTQQVHTLNCCCSRCLPNGMYLCPTIASFADLSIEGETVERRNTSTPETTCNELQANRVEFYRNFE